MTLRHMKIFSALCDNDCNTTKTAEALNMTQPAISQAIKEMEQYYNVSLFDRVGRKLIITDAGMILLNYAKHISSLFDEAENEMQALDKYGNIKVGATLTIGSLFLPRYVSDFKKEHPQIDIKALVAATNVLEEKILAFELDFALIEGFSHDASIVSEEYMTDELVIVGSPKSEFKDGQTISIEEFKKQKIIVRESGSGTREVFERATERAGFSMIPSWEAASVVALANAAISGLGLAVIPYRSICSIIEAGYLVRINVEGIDLNRKFYLIHHKDKHFSKSVKLFYDFCRDYVSEETVPSYL